MQLDWDRSTVSGHQDRIVVPLLWNANPVTGGLSTRKLVILKDSTGTRQAMIIEIIPDRDYYKQFRTRFYAGKFSGTLIERDLFERFQAGAYFENGKRKYAAILDTYRSWQQFHSAPKPEGCYYTSTAYYYNGVVTVVGTTVCTNDYDNTGGGGGSGPYDPNEHPWEDFIDEGDTGGSDGGSYEPPTPPSVKHIENNLVTPCLKQALHDLIMGAGVQSAISELIYHIFGSGDQINLFVEEANLGPGDDGITRYSGSGAYLNVTITLNTSVLAGSSKEYVAVTILHEFIHAYFDAKARWPLRDANNPQHNVMAGWYVSEMADALQETYPAISRTDAMDIAWGGLQQSLSWQRIVNTDPTEANRILATNTSYRNGQKGTKCN